METAVARGAQGGDSPTYLDHAATTAVYPEVATAMLPMLHESFGNPSGAHVVARAARRRIDESRDVIAAILGRQAREVVFTGGGTEALNLAIVGSLPDVGTPTIAWSSIEHDAVRNCVEYFAKRGQVESLALPGPTEGVLCLTSAAALLHPGVSVVAVMAVNNEVGTIQPIVALAEIVRTKAPNAVLVVDAVQAHSWIDLRAVAAVADFIVLSAHKFGGPQGVGALVVREGRTIKPLFHGGGQERERRSGTQNVAGIVGMATAAQITQERRNVVNARVAGLRDRLVDGLLGAITDCVETSPRYAKVAGNAHVCIANVESESLLVLLDRDGICASAGSACASGAMHASPVLIAMGVEKRLALGSLRLSLGASSTVHDVDRALAVIPSAVERLRS